MPLKKAFCRSSVLSRASSEEQSWVHGSLLLETVQSCKRSILSFVGGFCQDRPCRLFLTAMWATNLRSPHIESFHSGGLGSAIPNYDRVTVTSAHEVPDRRDPRASSDSGWPASPAAGTWDSACLPAASPAPYHRATGNGILFPQRYECCDVRVARSAERFWILQ